MTSSIRGVIADAMDPSPSADRGAAPLTSRGVRDWLRHFAKLNCLATLLLIFVGALVKSTGSGLAVPDWPLSFGGLFPPMVGGVFYEHGHRMAATLVGFLILCLAVLLALYEERRWVRTLGWTALTVVILQGLLGGLTVLLYLPTAVSLAHGVLAQTFFVLTIVIAYALSTERTRRGRDLVSPANRRLLKASCWVMGLIYLQLILGGVMRHTESGLAIPDFPTVGWAWVPRFDAAMLHKINVWRFDAGQDSDVTMAQVLYHFSHRVGALVVFFAVVWLNVIALRSACSGSLRALLIVMDLLLLAQIGLGVMTVLTLKQPHLTSGHVMVGAGLLGISTLLLLRSAPLSWQDLRRTLTN